ncbi:NucA/NucB deoxyribonuclease domain-containing protein [Streptomyces sp. NBC_00568]|uniref:NucA/NucB deoxyribonuclease domain-containing protein n=1 Tax=Streptomyces sp. NBC_00568 TaxID=2975779 RepID=UPI0022541733|nr:NucA/NucB deoxyribonuclease domain-containing protein [Streptomyces sp. NBC_00568]MCX4993548.1 NucA/NucB deoxyribonuclease domain-containing protein [Streptomyces sp. NBC_00568]
MELLLTGLWAPSSATRGRLANRSARRRPVRDFAALPGHGRRPAQRPAAAHRGSAATHRRRLRDRDLDTTIQTSPKGKKGDGQASAKWRFSNPEWAGPSNEIALPTPPVRCDNALPGTSKTGCVMPYIPEMVYARHGEFPELADHIEYAQTTKNLPGRHGTKRYLTRLTDKVKIKENRNTACPTSVPRPAGKQCDEYPFASTWQGAKTGGDFSRRLINGPQNEDGGRALSRFYLYNRIIEKDKFLTWIK